LRKREKFLKKAWHKIRRQVLTWANLFTLARILLVWPINHFITREDYKMVFFLGAIAGLTDLFDGKLARKLNQVTEVGKALDPFADKIYIVFIAWWLYPSDLALRWIAILAFLEMILIGLTALKGFLPDYTKNVELGSNIFGKTKFCFQCLLMVMLFLNKSQWLDFPLLSIKIIFIICYLLATASIYGHLRKAFWEIAQNNNGN